MGQHFLALDDFDPEPFDLALPQQLVNPLSHPTLTKDEDTLVLNIDPLVVERIMGHLVSLPPTVLTDMNVPLQALRNGQIPSFVFNTINRQVKSRKETVQMRIRRIMWIIIRIFMHAKNST